MNVKSIISSVLVLFVIASVIYLVVNETGSTSGGDAEMQAETSPQPPHQVVAYYFHGSKRCKTCLHIEAAAKEAIEIAYPEELKGSRVEWKVVNFEEATNADFAEKYQLIASSIVIVEFRNGQETQWKNLDKIWELVWDEEPFASYVQQEVLEYLNSDGEDG